MPTNSALHETTNIRVKKAMALIQRDLCDELSLNQVAQEVNLSPSRLRHLFKAEIGLTPVQYVKSLRMELAKELAATTFLSVKELVSHLGVTDQSHFLRDFKRAFGVTITEYRENCAAKSATE
jgi:AraC family transcriptional regulator of arabinose operon